MNSLFENKSALIYDVEILKAIPPKSSSKRVTGVDYCKGWEDYANMGIACIGAYDYGSGRYRVFGWESRAEFISLCQERNPLVSFNGIRFDNKVIEAAWNHSIPDDRCYDLLRQAWMAGGLDPDHFDGQTHGGYGLDALAKANFGLAKTGDGALAPVDWQRNRRCSVIDYCLNDVRITRRIWERVITKLPITAKGQQLTLESPS
jgi:hypothetical protein